MKIEEYRKMKRYKEGALKKKLGIGRNVPKTGEMIERANAMRRKKAAIMGLV